jgi:hypothetical protein
MSLLQIESGDDSIGLGHDRDDDRAGHDDHDDDLGPIEAPFTHSQNQPKPSPKSITRRALVLAARKVVMMMMIMMKMMMMMVMKLLFSPINPLSNSVKGLSHPHPSQTHPKPSSGTSNTPSPANPNSSTGTGSGTTAIKTAFGFNRNNNTSTNTTISTAPGSKTPTPTHSTTGEIPRVPTTPQIEDEDDFGMEGSSSTTTDVNSDVPLQKSAQNGKNSQMIKTCKICKTNVNTEITEA